MKKILPIFLLFLLLVNPAWATQYYAATTGLDANNGTSAGTPFQHIQKCATTMIAGDTCNIAAGTYPETVTPSNSGSSGNPITYTCTSGTCIVDAGNITTGWTLSSGSIYTANVGNLSGLSQVYVDGVFVDQARYPANSLLTTTSAGTSTQVIDTAIGTGGSNVLTSAQVVNASLNLRVNDYTWDNSTVATGFTVATGTIGLNTAPGSTMPSGWGFFLGAANGSGLTWMQTYPAEWYYDNANVLSLWTPASDTPANHTIDVSARPYVFNIGSKNYITIQNMTIKNAITSDISIAGGGHNIMNNNAFIGGYRGVNIATGTANQITNNTFTNQLFSAINGQNSLASTIITGNTITGGGFVGSPKVGRSEGGGIYITGNNNTATTITGNIISYSGYAGILIESNGGLVQNNIVDHSCMILQDCAGIYSSNFQTANTGWTLTIDHNTITNSIGYPTGTTDNHTLAQGIYLDDLSSGYTVTHNLINNVDYGIQLHSTNNNFINSNQVYAARLYALNGEESGSITGEGQGQMVSNIITHNVFESYGSNSNFGGGVVSFYSAFSAADFPNFGPFDYNIYCGPNTTYAVSTQGPSPTFTVTNYTISSWKSYFGSDNNSQYGNQTCRTNIATNSTIVNGTLYY